MLLRALPIVAALAGTASASIVSVSSPLQVNWLGAAPASVMPGALTGPIPFVFDEMQNIPVVNLPTDVINNPSTTPGTSFLGLLTDTVDSHFFHLDTGTGFFGTGSITFSGNIVGVQYRDISIDNTDFPHGAGATVYPTFFPGRGWNPLAPGFFTVNANVFTFDFVNNPGLIDIDQIRIFTQTVPTPGAASLLALGGLTALRRRRK